MVEESIVAAGAACAALAAKAYMNTSALQVHQVHLDYKNLPSSFEGFRILHLTDLHVTKWGKLEEKVLSALKTYPSDLVVFTGDLVTTRSGLLPFQKILKEAAGNCETYVVFGNTEHKYWDSNEIRDLCEASGIKVLCNSSAVIERSEEKICLVGVDDPYTGHANIVKASADIPCDCFKVLLAHTPVIADDAAKHGVSLMLSGHTHGGQLRLPVVGAIKTHLPKYRRLVMGLVEGDELSRTIGFDAGNLKVYVSRGIGTSYFPIRLMCPPEIPQYILHKA